MLKRKYDVKKVKEVKRLKRKGLSFRQIAKLLDSDVKTVFRWYKYDVGTYPQVRT